MGLVPQRTDLEVSPGGATWPAGRLVLLALALGGCGAAPAPVSTPAGCGLEIGDVLCDVALEGYVRDPPAGLASGTTYAALGLSSALASGTQPYALVFTTAFW